MESGVSQMDRITFARLRDYFTREKPVRISHKQWRSAESNRDVFRVLSEHDVLPDLLLNSLMKAASFRNILVHGYTRIDPSVVFALLKKMPHGPDGLVSGRDPVDGCTGISDGTRDRHLHPRQRHL